MCNYIGEDCVIPESVKLGKNIVIYNNVIIGEESEIGNNVVIYSGIKIGRNCKIGDSCVIGKQPSKAKLSATTEAKIYPPLQIGSYVTIGACSVIYAGSIIGDEVFIADLASMREEVAIGPLTIIGRGVAIENKVNIGKKVKIETEVYVTGLSTIEDFCFIAPGVMFSNDNFAGRSEERFNHFKGVHMKRGARIGVNSTVLPGVIIGEDSFVAGGSLVTKDVPPRIIVAGVPAKYFRDVPEEQLLENQTFFDKI